MYRRLSLVAAACGLVLASVPLIASHAAAQDGMSQSEAAATAASALAKGGATRDANGAVPLVTVEMRSGKPVITQHDVTSTQQAAAAVLEASKGNDLVSVAVDTPVKALGALPNDPLATTQWALTETTFTDAWSTTRGAGITVAVVDTGVAANHPDLAGKVLPGRQFLGGVSAPSDGTDPHGHGTHVAGIVAASAGNGIGIAGAAPDAAILPVRVLDSSGSGWTSDVAAGITWAANNGAKVINLSLGSSAPSSSLELAVNYALSRGVVVVAAAGNTGTTAINYPGGYPGVISVASHDSGGGRSYFSTMSTTNSVAAPGGSIRSTVPGGYAVMSGTSMATPYAAAAAALIVAAAPGISPAAVKSRLETTATDAGTVGFDTSFGWGRINPAAAVAVPAPAPTTTMPATTSTTATPGTLPPPPSTTVPPTTTMPAPTTTTPAPTTTMPAPTTTMPTPTTTTPPSMLPPGKPRASVIGGPAVVLTWTPLRGATSYIVYRSGLRVGTTNRSTWFDASVTKGATYRYTLAAVYPAGTTAQGAGTDVVVPGAPAKPGLTVSSPAPRQLLISATIPAGASRVLVSIPQGFTVMLSAAQPSVLIRNAAVGTYSVTARAVSATGDRSEPASATVTVAR